MRQIGKRAQGVPASSPSADSLRSARHHQNAGRALAAVATTGILKGIYRFTTHEEMNRHSDEALARAIAANVAHRACKSREER